MSFNGERVKTSAFAVILFMSHFHYASARPRYSHHRATADDPNNHHLDLLKDLDLLDQLVDVEEGLREASANQERQSSMLAEGDRQLDAIMETLYGKLISRAEGSDSRQALQQPGYQGIVWSGWSSCSATCGPGLRTKTCLQPGEMCPSVSEPCQEAECTAVGPWLWVAVGLILSSVGVLFLVGLCIYDVVTEARTEEEESKTAPPEIIPVPAEAPPRATSPSRQDSEVSPLAPSTSDQGRSSDGEALVDDDIGQLSSTPSESINQARKRRERTTATTTTTTTTTNVDDPSGKGEAMYPVERREMRESSELSATPAEDSSGDRRFWSPFSDNGQEAVEELEKEEEEEEEEDGDVPKEEEEEEDAAELARKPGRLTKFVKPRSESEAEVKKGVEKFSKPTKVEKLRRPRKRLTSRISRAEKDRSGESETSETEKGVRESLEDGAKFSGSSPPVGVANDAAGGERAGGMKTKKVRISKRNGQERVGRRQQRVDLTPVEVDSEYYVKGAKAPESKVGEARSANRRFDLQEGDSGEGESSFGNHDDDDDDDDKRKSFRDGDDGDGKRSSFRDKDDNNDGDGAPAAKRQPRGSRSGDRSRQDVNDGRRPSDGLGNRVNLPYREKMADCHSRRRRDIGEMFSMHRASTRGRSERRLGNAPRRDQYETWSKTPSWNRRRNDYGREQLEASPTYRRRCPTGSRSPIPSSPDWSQSQPTVTSGDRTNKLARAKWIMQSDRSLYEDIMYNSIPRRRYVDPCRRPPAFRLSPEPAPFDLPQEPSAFDLFPELAPFDPAPEPSASYPLPLSLPLPPKPSRCRPEPPRYQPERPFDSCPPPQRTSAPVHDFFQQKEEEKEDLGPTRVIPCFPSETRIRPCPGSISGPPPSPSDDETAPVVVSPRPCRGTPRPTLKELDAYNSVCDAVQSLSVRSRSSRRGEREEEEGPRCSWPGRRETPCWYYDACVSNFNWHNFHDFGPAGEKKEEGETEQDDAKKREKISCGTIGSGSRTPASSRRQERLCGRGAAGKEAASKSGPQVRYINLDDGSDVSRKLREIEAICSFDAANANTNANCGHEEQPTTAEDEPKFESTESETRLHSDRTHPEVGTDDPDRQGGPTASCLAGQNDNHPRVRSEPESDHFRERIDTRPACTLEYYLDDESISQREVVYTDANVQTDFALSDCSSDIDAERAPETKNQNGKAWKHTEADTRDSVIKCKENVKGDTHPRRLHPNRKSCNSLAGKTLRMFKMNKMFKSTYCSGNTGTSQYYSAKWPSSKVPKLMKSQKGIHKRFSVIKCSETPHSPIATITQGDGGKSPHSDHKQFQEQDSLETPMPQ